MRPVREVVQRVLVAVHVALDDGLHPLVLVVVIVDVDAHGEVLLQVLRLPDSPEQNLAVHEEHVVHRSPPDVRAWVGRACRECGLLVEHRLIPCGLPLQPGQITKVSHGTRSYAKPQPRHSYLFAEALYGTVIRSETTLPQNAPQIAVLDASPIAMLRNHSLDVDARLQGHLSLPDVLPRECEVLVRAQGHCGLPVDDHVEKVHCRLRGAQVEEARIEDHLPHGVRKARPPHGGVVVHIVEAVGGGVVPAIGHGLHVHVAPQVVEGILEEHNVDVGKQHGVAQLHEVPQDAELHARDAVVGHPQLLLRALQLYGHVVRRHAPLLHLPLGLRVDGNDHRVLDACRADRLHKRLQHPAVPR
mmetsp:Transcript_38360/g.98069  ORF Transcript_38360/g.98069 Transcript_38360/m.98069 type:complete len:359 (+) Transcript_38360:307-1383(+)